MIKEEHKTGVRESLLNLITDCFDNMRDDPLPDDFFGEMTDEEIQEMYKGMHNYLAENEGSTLTDWVIETFLPELRKEK